MQIPPTLARDGRNAALTELLFVALPIIASLAVFLLKHKSNRSLMSPEWAFAAAVLAGHGIVRLTEVSSRGTVSNVELLKLLSALLVSLYGASVGLLVILLIMEDDCPLWIGWLQIAAFVVAAFAFLLFAALAHVRGRAVP